MKVRLVHKKTSTFHDFPYDKPQRKCIHTWIVNVTPPGADHCIHHCVYCYARDAVFARDAGGVLEVYDNLPELVAHDLDRISLCPPFSISNTTDPCQAVPEVRREVVRLVTLLLDRGLSFLIVTKGDATFLLDVPGLVAHPRRMVATTIEGPPEVLRLLSPEAPAFEARLDSVRRLADAGVFTAIRLDPLFPPVYAAFYGSAWRHRVTELLREFAATGCRHVIVSTGRLARTAARGQTESSMARLQRLVGTVDRRGAERFPRDYVFDRSGTSTGYLWRREERLEFHRWARSTCESLGMTYATCQETGPGEMDSAGIPHCEGGDLPFCVKGLDGRFEPVAGCTAQCHASCRGRERPPCGRAELVSTAPLRLSQLR
jgi:DNA repair photolyase